MDAMSGIVDSAVALVKGTTEALPSSPGTPADKSKTKSETKSRSMSPSSEHNSARMSPVRSNKESSASIKSGSTKSVVPDFDKSEKAFSENSDKSHKKSIEFSSDKLVPAKAEQSTDSKKNSISVKSESDDKNYDAQKADSKPTTPVLATSEGFERWTNKAETISPDSEKPAHASESVDVKCEFANTIPPSLLSLTSSLQVLTSSMPRTRVMLSATTSPARPAAVR